MTPNGYNINYSCMMFIASEQRGSEFMGLNLPLYKVVSTSKPMTS